MPPYLQSPEWSWLILGAMFLSAVAGGAYFAYSCQGCAQIRIVPIEITEHPAQQRVEFRLAMIALRANLDQLDKVRGRLGAQVILPDPAKRIAQDRLGQGVEIRFPAAFELNFRFEKQVELPRKNALRAARTSGAGRSGSSNRSPTTLFWASSVERCRCSSARTSVCSCP